MTLPHRPVSALLRTLSILVLLALLTVAHAQVPVAPRVGLAPLTTSVGGTVVIDADRLTPGATYRLEVRSPSGRSDALSAEASDAGALRFEVVLSEAGTSEFILSGPDIEALLRARATEPEAPAAAEPEAPAEAGPAEAPDDAPTASPDADPPPQMDEIETSEPAPSPVATTTLLLVDGGAELVDATGDTLWRFSRPADSGGTRAAIVHLGRAWIAHGHTVLELDLADGHVISRASVSGPIVSLEPLGSGVRAVAEIDVDGATQRTEHRVENGFASPAATFEPTSSVFEWWRAEANVADPSAALRRDPTNPHLYVQVATLAEDERDREEALRGALAAGGPFFERAQVARSAAALGFFELADEAMRAAVADFSMRGYDPALLTDADAHERYGFALRPLRRALADGDLTAAAFWADWLPRTAGNGMPGAAAALREYADALRDAGDSEASAAIRERAAALSATSAQRILSGAAVDLGRGGWYAAAALLAAALILHLTLIGKYWRVQELLIRRARESGRRASVAWHWRAMRHYGTTEKLSLVLLLVTAHAVGALAVWSERGDAAVNAAAGGHLTAPYVAPLLQPGATASVGHVRLLEGYRLQRVGASDEARLAFEAARQAGVGEAEAALAALEREDALWAPSSAAVRDAITGSWQRAVGDAFRDPFGYLAAAEGSERVPAWVSPIGLGVFLAFAALHLLALLIPRPRLARNAPRTPLYHLLALLVPGAGATDELWGVLLLVPWAVFGIDAVAQLVWASSPLDIPLLTGAWILAALYAVNLVAWAIELGSYRRRMRALRRDDPELALEYHMKPLPAGR